MKLNAYEFAIDSLNEKGVPKSTIKLLNELLEKQKPKEVKNKLIDGNYYLVCSGCEKIVQNTYQSYCSYCGQATSLNNNSNKVNVYTNRHRKGIRGSKT